MNRPSLRPLTFLALPLIGSSCVTTKAYRHQNGTVTVTRDWNNEGDSYWIAGAKPGAVSTADQLTVFRKEFIGKPTPAVPVRCAGFVDTTDTKRIEIRLVEKRDGRLQQAWANGRHKLVDENAPKPFYHWLIP
jgi:hypothetical protein